MKRPGLRVAALVLTSAAMSLVGCNKKCGDMVVDESRCDGTTLRYCAASPSRTQMRQPILTTTECRPGLCIKDDGEVKCTPSKTQCDPSSFVPYCRPMAGDGGDALEVVLCEKVTEKRHYERNTALASTCRGGAIIECLGAGPARITQCPPEGSTPPTCMPAEEAGTPFAVCIAHGACSQTLPAGAKEDTRPGRLTTEKCLGKDRLELCTHGFGPTAEIHRFAVAPRGSLGARKCGGN